MMLSNFVYCPVNSKHYWSVEIKAVGLYLDENLLEFNKKENLNFGQLSTKHAIIDSGTSLIILPN